MADRVEQLDCAPLGRGLPRAARALSRPHRARSARPLDAAARGRIGGSARRRARPRRCCSTTTARCASSSSHPDLAAPTPEIRELLLELAALPGTSVHLVSGRKHETLEVLARRPARSISAPSTATSSGAAGGEWRSPLEVDLSWLPRVERLFRPCRRRRSRNAGRAEGRERRRGTTARPSPSTASGERASCSSRSKSSLRASPAEVLPGHRVIEVRARGVNKGDVPAATPHGEGGRADGLPRRRRRPHRQRSLCRAPEGLDRDPRRRDAPARDANAARTRVRGRLAGGVARRARRRSPRSCVRSRPSGAEHGGARSRTRARSGS